MEEYQYQLYRMYMSETGRIHTEPVAAFITGTDAAVFGKTYANVHHLNVLCVGPRGRVQVYAPFA